MTSIGIDATGWSRVATAVLAGRRPMRGLRDRRGALSRRGRRPGHSAPISVGRRVAGARGHPRGQGHRRGWSAHLPELEPPLTFTLIAGGRSNLTYRVEDAAGRAWALRRPPLHHVLPTAHDMTREYRLMHSLGPGGHPGPA